MILVMIEAPTAARPTVSEPLSRPLKLGRTSLGGASVPRKYGWWSKSWSLFGSPKY